MTTLCDFHPTVVAGELVLRCRQCGTERRTRSLRLAKIWRKGYSRICDSPPKLTPEDLDRRRSICQDCESFDPETCRACRACARHKSGDDLFLKGRCRKGKWP